MFDNRTQRNDRRKICRLFVKTLKEVITQNHPLTIINMDETFVKPANYPRLVVANRGAESVPFYCQEDYKEGFTALSSITYSGQVLEPIILKKPSSHLETNGSLIQIFKFGILPPVGPQHH